MTHNLQNLLSQTVDLAQGGAERQLFYQYGLLLLTIHVGLPLQRMVIKLKQANYESIGG
jgi:hypothetical protein